VPALALVAKRHQPLNNGRLGHDDNIHALTEMRHRALELIERRRACHPTRPRGTVYGTSSGVHMKNLLFSVAFVLLIIWLLGMIGIFAAGAALHLLLLTAVILFVISFSRDQGSIV
jgi:hypothetical protein